MVNFSGQKNFLPYSKMSNISMALQRNDLLAGEFLYMSAGTILQRYSGQKQKFENIFFAWWPPFCPEILQIT
jgi:hypothetical protein